MFSGCNLYSSGAGIVINEVVSSSSRLALDGSIGTPDWIELYNASAKDIDLRGYKLTDGQDTTPSPFSNAVLRAGEYIIVYAPGSKALASPDHCCVDFEISKDGESLYLLGPTNTIENRVTVPALLTDVSFARRGDSSYGYSTDITPGSKNSDTILNLDGLLATFVAGALTISEVLPKSLSSLSWVELYNGGNEDMDLQNFWLSDEQGEPFKWHMPSRTLQAGEYTVVYFSKDDNDKFELCAPFELGRDDTELILSDLTGRIVHEANWDKEIPEGVSVLSDLSYCAYPTPGEANISNTFSSVDYSNMSERDPVRISEVLPVNTQNITDVYGERAAWVELFNSGSEAVSLLKYYLSDSSDNPFKWAFPDIKIAAGEYLVVFLSANTTTTRELHASFRLSRSEESIYLTNLDGMRMDTMTMPQTFAENVSVGRSENGQPLYYTVPSPGTLNTQGSLKPVKTVTFNIDGVYISEVCAVNRAKSGINDWIELYNGSSETVDLAGYTLSDEPSNPGKWTLPQISLAQNEYVVIEASADPTQRSENTAGFGISPNGETLLLSDRSGAIIDKFETGVLSFGITSGRIIGEPSVPRVFFDMPTRGLANAQNFLSGYAAMPVFSDTQLHHTQAFSVAIVCATAGSKIYYTTDGSLPTQDALLYISPIAIEKNTPLRAVAFADGLLPSEAATTTYLFDAQHDVPVFCIVGEPDEMQHLLNTNSRRDKPEYNSDVSYYEADGTLGVSFSAGLRPKGRSSMRNPQNSLMLHLRSAYGQREIIYPFFESSAISTYTALVLRNAGQDNALSRIHDSLFQNIAKGLNVDTIDTKVVVAYVNGKYCGVYDFDEEQNAGYIEAHYGLDENSIDMIDRNSTEIYGSNEEFLKIRKIARTWDMADDEVFAEFSQFVDVDACTDYLIMQIYFGNGDVMNQRFWRADDYSVKWRPLLFDLDWSMRFNTSDRNVFHRYFSRAPLAGNDTVTYMDIFCALNKNEAWRDRFVERFVELAYTQFSEERVLRIFDEMSATMRPEMPAHIAVWNTPRSMRDWESQIAKLRSALIKRQGIELAQLQRYFRVTDEQMQVYIDKYSS